jgi:DNA repair protein RecO (recombination protein O)
MLQKTEGIVLKTVRYSDTSLIAHIYTRDYGWLNFIIPGIRSSRNKSKGNIIQPLQYLELEIYFASNRNLMKLKEYRPAYIYSFLHQDMHKQSVALFALEVFSKCVKEQEQNIELFDFLSDYLISLDNSNENLKLAAPNFLLKFSQYLGFQPLENEDGRYFHLLEGHFTEIQDGYTLNEEESNLWRKMLKDEMSEVSKNFEREVLLEKLLLYFKMHMPGFPELNTVSVLKNLLH